MGYGYLIYLRSSLKEMTLGDYTCPDYRCPLHSLRGLVTALFSEYCQMLVPTIEDHTAARPS